MHYDCDDNDCEYGCCDCDYDSGGCDTGDDIDNTGTMIVINAPGIADREEILGYDDSMDLHKEIIDGNIIYCYGNSTKYITTLNQKTL